MTEPNKKDVNAVAGTHPGTKSQEEIENKITFKFGNKSLADTANQIIKAAEWNFNSFSDPRRAPKYAVDPEVSYFGSGSLSLLPRLGKLIMSSSANEANRGAFSLDQSESTFYSSLSKTTLGSLNIDTVDGQMLNPQSPTQPSTNYSPTKPWIKKLFPTLSSKNLMSIAILELITATLLKVFDNKAAPSSENSERKQDVDIGTIIIDNQEIEDQLFGVT